MKMLSTHSRKRIRGFSLTEVVLALGVVGVAILAILGVFPAGLETSRGAQDETRAPQIAQSIFGSLASQHVKRDGTGKLMLDSNGRQQINDAAKIPSIGTTIDLTATKKYANMIYAKNDGQLTTAAAGAAYAITIDVNSAPTGFDPGNGNQVTVSVAWPAGAPAASRTKRDYVRIISKY